MSEVIRITLGPEDRKRYARARKTTLREPPNAMLALVLAVPLLVIKQVHGGWHWDWSVAITLAVIVLAAARIFWLLSRHNATPVQVMDAHLAFIAVYDAIAVEQRRFDNLLRLKPARVSKEEWERNRDNLTTYRRIVEQSVNNAHEYRRVVQQLEMMADEGPKTLRSVA